MKKVFLFLLAAVALVACGDKENVSTSVESISLSPSTLEIGVGSTKGFYLSVTPTTAEYTAEWTSSNEEVATISSIGNLTALSEGTTTITVSVDEGAFTATCEVTVKSKLDMLVFDQAVLWTLEEYYAISDEYGYSYDGVRIDSAVMCLFYVLADDIYIIDDAPYFAGNDNYAIQMHTSFSYNSQYWFSYGTYTMAESIIDEDGNYSPYTIQIGHFDADVYTGMYQDMVDGNFTSRDDYPYYEEWDSYFYLLEFYDSETVYLVDGGYLSAAGGQIQFSTHAYETGGGFYGLPYYSFEAKFFDNIDAYGFKTETVDGVEDWVYPLEMNELVTKTMSYGSASAPASAPQVGKVDRVSGELQVSLNRLTKQAFVTKLLDANYKIK